MFVVMLCAGVVCLGGCGGIPDAAMQSLQKGDAILQKVVAQVDPLLYELESLFTDYAYGENTEPYGVNQTMTESKATALRLAAMSREAEAYFDKALSVPGAGGCTEYVGQARAVLQQVERIPGVADRGFRVIDTLANIDTTVGEKAMETSLYKGSRSLIQINIETHYAVGYADYLASKLGIRSGQASTTAPASHTSGS